MYLFLGRAKVHMVMKVSLLSNLSEIHVPYLADARTSKPIQEKRVRKAIIIAIPQIYSEFSGFHLMFLHFKNKTLQVLGSGGKNEISASERTFGLVKC